MPESHLAFSEKEQSVLRAYRDPRNSGIGRTVRLSIQYAAGAGVFLWLAIDYGDPWYSVAVYAIFVLFMALRIWSASRVAGLMPGIIRKYEARIRDLESHLPSTRGDNDA